MSRAKLLASEINTQLEGHVEAGKGILFVDLNARQVVDRELRSGYEIDDLVEPYLT